MLYAVTLSFVTHLVLASFLEHIWTRYVWLLVGLSAILASPSEAPAELDVPVGSAVEASS